MSGSKLILVIVLIAFTQGVAADYYAALPAWERVLNQFVDEQGRTDFRALAKDRADLDSVVTAIANDGPQRRPDAFDTPEKVLAYHINAYNAVAMHGVT